MNWDDDAFILSNAHLHAWSWDNVRWMFATADIGNYIPATWLSLALDHTLWGARALGYHLTSLLLHGLNAVLFFFLSRRLLQATAPATKPSDSRGLALWAVLAALLFSVHPLRVESVVWISERKDVLSGFFYLLTLLAYLRAASGPRRRVWLGAALAAYVAALASKAVVISLPVALTLLDVYPLRRLSADPRRWLARPTREIWTEKAPFWLLSLGFGLVGFAAQDRPQSMRSFQAFGAASRAAQACYGLAFYLRKTLLPFRLSPLYEMPKPLDAWSAPFLLSALAVLGITAAAIRARRRAPAGAAAWAFYALTLSPMLGLVSFGPQIVACRYSYLSCLSWPLLAVGALRSYKRNGRAALAAASALVLGLAVLTWRQTTVWHDSFSLWNAALAVDPDTWNARHNLGLALAGQGRLAEAGAQFEEAVRLRPDDADDWSNLGLSRVGRGLDAEALTAYAEALRVDPNHPDAHNNAGLILLRQRRFHEAGVQFTAALRARPAFAPARNNLGIVLAELGRREEAAAQFQEALRLDPGYAEAADNLRRLRRR